MTERSVKAEIRRLLDEALKRYGPSIELTAIESSWGDTLDDDETLEWLGHFLARGTGFDQVHAKGDDFDELDKSHRDDIAKH